MSGLNRAADLDNAILVLEQQCRQHEQDIKMMGSALANDLKPVNLIKSAFKSTAQTPGFGPGLIKGAVGLAAGLLTKRLFLKKDAGFAKKAIGTAVELGVAKSIAGHAGKIVAGGIRFFNRRHAKAGTG